MSKFHYLICNGHGGMIEGNYVTAPKKMFDFGDGFVFYEGVFNRLVVDNLCEKLAENNIDFTKLVPEQKDIPLSVRVKRADDLHAIHGNCVFIDIHANAGGGKGYEIYTSVGQTLSDRMAEHMFDAFEKVYPEDSVGRKDMSDGDKDKEANFYVLRKTDCPAMLTECGFMDNRKEAEWMMSDEGVETIAEAHLEGIKRIELTL